MKVRSPHRRQPLLVLTPDPLTERLGDAFFRALPREPGVYFFHDAADTLLYIGQSGCLRDRLGSYRYVDPDRHPRRSLRLISRVARIHWRVCASPAEAVALEAGLLREHRPPFNRAGVWPSAEWWLQVSREDGRLEMRLAQAPAEGEPGEWTGPLGAGFRYSFPLLTRCLYRAMCPAAGIHEFPAGLFQPRPFLTVSWGASPDHGPWLDRFMNFLTGGGETDFPDRLAEAVLALETTPRLLEFWTEQTEELRKFLLKPKAKAAPAAVLSPENP